MFKFIRRIVFLVVLLLIAGVVLLFSLDGLANTAVEKSGTYALGTNTTAAGTSVGLAAGKITVKDLRVANPPGFGTDPFVAVTETAATLDGGTVFSQPIVVKTLELRGIRLKLEQQSGKMNYDPILEALKRFQGSSDKTSGGSKRLLIKELVLADITVGAQLLPIPGVAPSPEVKIPEIRLSNVGGASNDGVLIADAVNVVIQSLLTSVATSGGGLLPPDLAKDLGSRVSGLSNIAGGALGVLQQLGGGKDVDKIRDGLNSILGGKK